MKITYVIDSLASKGGAERIILNKMEYLAKHFGYDVSVITCYQDKDTPNAYPVPTDLTQYRLGIPFYSQYRYGFPYRLWVKRKLKHQLFKRLSETINTIAPDILIGVSYFEADVVLAVDCRAKKIIEVHEPRPFTLSGYGLHRGRLSNWYMNNYRKRYFKKVEHLADVVVTLTPGDAREWHAARSVIIIPNFTVIPHESSSLIDSKRVIAVGRFEWVKGYDRLLEAWKIVSEKHPDWHLDMFGTGTLESDLKKQQKELELQKYLTIHPATSEINKEYVASSIFVSTSHFEGFPLVLLEAMQVGLPCVSFDCPFGPSAIIDDGINGFLVQDGNINELAEKLSLLIEKPELRRCFSEAALEKSKLFAVDKVMLMWKELFEDLI